MLKRVALTYGLLCFMATNLGAQDHENSFAFWRLASINGEAKLRSMYRHKYTSLNDLTDYQESLYFSGGLRVDSRSYIWHPNFLKLDLGAAYFPESNQDDYVVNPDRSEIRTLKGLNLGATLFDTKPVTLSSFANWNDSYQNRENLTNIRSKTRRLGASFAVKNRILPLYLDYQKMDWDQEEVQTGRIYMTGQDNFEVSSQKSFTTRDRTELKYIHGRFSRWDLDLPEIQNIDDILSLKNRLYLDKEKKYIFNTSVSNTVRSGNQAFRVFDARERLCLKMPAGFDFRGSYNLHKKQEEGQNLNRNKLNTSLNHQLYKSLQSTLDYEYSGIRHTYYQETRNTMGLNLNYNKKIPSGQLNIAYNYSFLRNRMEAEPVNLPVFNEPYELNDGEITLLRRPYVDMNSVVVKDASGTFIYQSGFDYIILEQGEFLEMQRVPGGQIPNGATVFVDYVSVQTGSYKYDAHTNNFSARVIVLRRFLELYYQGRFLGYKNIERSDLLVLNYIQANTVGGLVRVKFAELGAEYEVHNSTITPYRQQRYFLNLQERFGKVLLYATGNYRNYFLTDEGIHRMYTDLSARGVYEFSPRTKVSALAGYRKQIGAGIDLNLLTATLEFKTRIRMLYLSTGVEVYRRDYLGDDTNYYGAYVQMQRRF